MGSGGEDLVSSRGCGLDATGDCLSMKVLHKSVVKKKREDLNDLQCTSVRIV